MRARSYPSAIQTTTPTMSLVGTILLPDSRTTFPVRALKLPARNDRHRFPINGDIDSLLAMSLLHFLAALPKLDRLVKKPPTSFISWMRGMCSIACRAASLLGVCAFGVQRTSRTACYVFPKHQWYPSFFPAEIHRQAITCAEIILGALQTTVSTRAPFHVSRVVGPCEGKSTTAVISKQIGQMQANG